MSKRPAEFVDYARRYGELGWALIRLEGKVPKGNGWQQTPPDPDPEHLAGLWNEWGKRHNVGVVLGQSGLAVAEYDTEAGGQKLLELFGGKPPLTPTVRTGSDRLHFYFQPPAGFEKRVREGIELRLGAHQCVLPPSEHPDTGKPYAWLPGASPGRCHWPRCRRRCSSTWARHVGTAQRLWMT
jgi:Bifunctional DNA primase/polymerase, N-terminal